MHTRQTDGGVGTVMNMLWEKRVQKIIVVERS